MEGFGDDISGNREQILSINEAVSIIYGIMAQVSGMGANDREMRDLEKLAAAVGKGEILPQKGVEIAEGIMASKQSYH